MGSNKVSEKAIWEGSITPDNDTPSITPQMQTHPQMMFCYKCNNVIPSDSTFCPYCQIKLFVECPKCGAKYSSQYPACSKCGTNREEYLQIQRREAERKAAIERENKRRQEIEERKRLEEERKRKEAEEEKERQEKYAYFRENAKIIGIEEFETTYSILNEALKALDDKKRKKKKITLLLFVIPYIYIALDSCFIDLANSNMELYFTIVIILVVISVIAIIVSNVHDNDRKWQEEYLMQYASSKCRNRENLLSTHLISMVWYQGEKRLSDCCIIAYRKKHNLTINYKWHNLI